MSSFVSIVTLAEFRQCSPRQSPQAGTHFKPNFRHVHRLLLHGFFESFLHLQRMNFNKLSGAIGSSVGMGTRLLFSPRFQPHCNGSPTETSRVSHTIICRCARKLCCFAAPSVGGNFAGIKPQRPVVIISWNFEHLRESSNGIEDFINDWTPLQNRKLCSYFPHTQLERSIYRKLTTLIK